MKNLLTLVTLGIKVKLNLWKCRMFDKITDEYCLAKHYQNALDNLQDSDEGLSTLVSETRNLQVKFASRKEIMDLLDSIMLFLKQLQLIKNY